MIKLIAFDVDNTLCELNSPMKDSTLRYLQNLKDRGVRIVLISGKPTIYLCGFVRQLGLTDITVIGENGVEIYYDANVPPKKTINLAKDKSKYLNQIKTSLEEEFGDLIWFQPNRINVTCFFNDEGIRKKIKKLLDEIFKVKDYNENLEVYEHIDCFDIVIKGISKGSCIKALCEYDNICFDEVVAVGDSRNDFSMFDVAKVSIGINLYEDYDVNYKFNNIDDAMKFILHDILGE
ncbi:MAG: HAD family hydrolase [Sedimentibacter saalensis]|uniref:HAD family hydrolase n=1 Tax=Sedimentibacter saalensis TaxID=130788 RepID=UPI0031588421